jgi:integrase
LTIELLARILQNIDLSDYNNMVYGCMLCMGVYCLLRIGELCYSKENKVEKMIRNKDICFKHDHIEFIIRYSKTDKDRKGIRKYIADIPSAKLNPYDMMRRFKCAKLSKCGKYDPFFALEDGKAVSRVMLVTFLQNEMGKICPEINRKEWSGISLRKGGATSALRAGVQGETIEKLGHWRSDVYKRYISHEGTDVKDAQFRMSKLVNG